MTSKVISYFIIIILLATIMFQQQLTGVAVDSFVRKYEADWSKREGERPVKQCPND